MKHKVQINVDSLKNNGFTKSDFSSWVLNGNIDTAQNVRLLPSVLKEKDSRNEFLKTNITEAYKKVDIPATSVDISAVSYLDLCKTLTNKLDKIDYKEAKLIQSERGIDKKSALLLLRQSIDFVLGEESEEE